MMPANESSLITTICLVAYVAFIFGMGHLSDKFGRKKMLIIACVSFIVLTVPAFMLLNTAQFFTVLAVELVLCLALTINDGTLSSYLTETFPTAVRYTASPCRSTWRTPVRRFRLVHLDCSDRRYRLRSRACLVHGRRVLCRAGGDDTIARTYG